GTATSTASAGTLSLTIPAADSPTITASFVMAQSTATCAGVSGSSTITGLSVSGFGTIPVSGMPNQVVVLGFGAITLTINEQIITSSGGTNSITVNALHIAAPVAGIDIIIASAHSDITCAAPSPHKDHDCVTGSGEERGSSDGKSQ